MNYILIDYKDHVVGKDESLRFLKKLVGDDLPSAEVMIKSNGETEFEQRVNKANVHLYVSDGLPLRDCADTCFYLAYPMIVFDILRNPERYKFDGLLTDIHYTEAVDYGVYYDMGLEYDEDSYEDEDPDESAVEEYMINRYGDPERDNMLLKVEEYDHFLVEYWDCFAGLCADRWRLKKGQKRKVESLAEEYKISVSKYVFEYMPCDDPDTVLPSPKMYDSDNVKVEVFEAAGDNAARLYVLRKYYNRFNDCFSKKTGNVYKAMQKYLDERFEESFESEINSAYYWGGSEEPVFLYLMNYDEKRYINKNNVAPFASFDYELDTIVGTK